MSVTRPRGRQKVTLLISLGNSPKNKDVDIRHLPISIDIFPPVRVVCQGGPQKKKYRHSASIKRSGYIEGFYDPRRLHSSLGYISPAEAERRAA
jgi:hypothetical protein